MAQRMIVFDAESLLNLLVHYSDGEIDLDAQLKGAGINPWLQRYIGLQVASDHWPADTKVNAAGQAEPLHIRYHGNRILSWTDNDQDSIDGRSYAQRNESPNTR